MQSVRSTFRATCAFVAIALSSGVYSQTNIPETTLTDPSGYLWSTTGSPYVIQGNVILHTSLTIEPGVVVQFEGPHTFTVNGTLKAQGIETNKITFTSATSSPVAARLIFTNASADATFDVNNSYTGGSILEHVIVEKLGSGNASVEIERAHPFIHLSVFRQNIESAIQAYNINSLLRIENSVFEDNNAIDGGGIWISTEVNGNIRLQNNVFRNNVAYTHGGGVYASIAEGSSLSLTGNRFEQNLTGHTEIVNGVTNLIGQGGGAHLFVDGTASGSGNSYLRNDSKNAGGGIFAGLTQELTGSVDFARETIISNKTGNNGGGLAGRLLNVTIADSLIEGNEAAAMGGGLFLDGPSYQITRCVVANNISRNSHSGGIDLHGQSATVTDTIIASNASKMEASGIGFTYASGSISNSSIVFNYGLTNNSNAMLSYNAWTAQNNTIAYNRSLPRSAISSSSAATITGNNILGNETQYDLLSNFNGSPTLAQPNWWGTADMAIINGRVKEADGSTAVINYENISTTAFTNTPVSPPSGVTVTATGVSHRITWNANPESDVRGYIVHWGTLKAPYFSNHVDVGNTLEHEINGLDGGNYYVAVTAYDADYNASIENEATPVNENQTAGYESWYSAEKPIVVVDVDLEVGISAVSNFAPNNVMKTGEPMLFKVSVTNHGPSDTGSNTAVSVEIPAGFSAASSTNCTAATNSSPESNPTMLTCNFASVALNATVTESIPGMVITTSTDPVTISAEITASDVDSNPANNSVSYSFVVNRPDVTLSWNTAPVSGVANSPITYRITARNLSRVAASNVAISIAVPANTTAASSACIVAGSTITCTAASLPIYNSEQTFEFALTPSVVGSITVDATATATEPEVSTSNNAISATTTVAENVSGGGNPDPEPVVELKKKKGGGAFEVLWLMLLIAGLALRRRHFRFAPARA